MLKPKANCAGEDEVVGQCLGGGGSVLTRRESLEGGRAVRMAGIVLEMVV